MENENKWLKLSIELQALAQAGLEYSKDKFDLERFERIREISAEMLSCASQLPLKEVTELFCGEKGYQTPKIDTRAAIIEDGKILLVKESDGKWSLPGGWCDVDMSVKENTVKEAFEEAGLNIEVEKLAFVHDRKKHNGPVCAYNICKFFFICKRLSGSFKANTETTESGWFSLDGLPEISESKNNYEQIKLCFEAYSDKNREVTFD